MNRTKLYVLFLLWLCFACQAVFAQTHMKVRIAKIVIDSAYLGEYCAALAGHAAIAVKTEPGVIALNAVYNKDTPTHVTVFEIYASDSAYRAHIKTPHFLKYKTSTLHMVKSLELTDVVPIALESKPVAKP